MKVDRSIGICQLAELRSACYVGVLAWSVHVRVRGNGYYQSMKRLIFLVLLVACTNQNDQGAAPTGSATPPSVAMSAATNAAPTSTERPLAAESNPPGD